MNSNKKNRSECSKKESGKLWPTCEIISINIYWRVIPHQINIEKRHFQTRPTHNWQIFCKIVVPMEISIPAKFYCFDATRFLRADIWICRKKKSFLVASWLRKSGITSALTQIQNLFYAHFKADKMPFQMTYYTNIFSITVFSRSISLIFDLLLLEIWYFNFFFKKKDCVHVTVI
jgi:hypothetical protein